MTKYWERPAWTVVLVYYNVAYMANSMFIHLLEHKKSIWEIFPKRITVPVSVFRVITVFLLRTNVGMKWICCKFHFCSDFFWLVVICFIWRTWIQTTLWDWDLSKKKKKGGKTLTHREGFQFYLLTVNKWNFFHEFQFYPTKVHISLAFKLDHCK